MKHYLRSYLFALFVLGCQQSAIAQTTVEPQAQKKVDTTRTRTRDGVDPMIAVRRQTAVTLVTSLADEARSFRDDSLRARVQARAGDALWETDRKRARELFKRAWEAAAVADTDAQRRYQEKLREARAAVPPRNLRVEVLRIISRRDRALGDKLLASLTEDKSRESSADTSNASMQTGCPAATEIPPLSVVQRLDMARQLLASGDVQRATQTADPVLVCVTMNGLNFLSELRAKNKEQADERYAAMVKRAGTSVSSDANTVSLLSSYVLTPFLYLTVDKKGGMSANQFVTTITPPELPAALSRLFFNTAAQILLRPMLVPQADLTSAGRPGKYFIMARLMPLFEQYAPERAAALHIHLSALRPEAPEIFRNGSHELLTKGLTTNSVAKVEPSDLELEAKNAPNSDERDRIYASAAINAAQKDDPHARSIAEKISAEVLRQRVFGFIDFTAVSSAIRQKNTDEIVRLARNGELTHAQRVLALTQAANFSLKTNPSLSNELLEESVSIARRIDPDNRERVSALVSIVNTLLKFDRVRAWEMMDEVVKITNGVKDFNGNDAQVAVEIQLKDNTFVTNSSAPYLSLSPVFGVLAKEDMDRAVELARTLKGESPRAASILAIVRSVLEEQTAAARP